MYSYPYGWYEHPYFLYEHNDEYWKILVLVVISRAVLVAATAVTTAVLPVIRCSLIASCYVD
jgi:hypothetical protein